MKVAASAIAGNRLIAALAVGVAVAGLALRLSIAWLDLETLTVKVLPDDAFYYFLTADRISNGQNISFDGITLSNGYHPLWLFFLVPLYLLPGRELPLHLALTASSLFAVIAAALVALAAARLTGNKFAGLFSFAFYLFLPQNVFASVNGVESNLTAMLLAALLLTLVSVWHERRDDWLRWSILTGVLGGLTILARLDSALVVVAILAVIALLQSRERRWQAPLVAGSVAAVLVLPWLLWSLVAVGTVVPVSAESSTWLFREHTYAANPDMDFADKVQKGLSATKNVFLTQLPKLYLPPRPFAAAIFAGMSLLGAHFLLLSKGALRRETARHLLVAGVPLAAFIGMLLFNSGYRWFVRGWYFAWGMPTVALFGGVVFAYLDAVVSPALHALQRRVSSSRAPVLAETGPLLVAFLVVLLLVAYTGSARDAWRTGYFPFQRGNLDAARYLKANTEPDARTASFNAGVIGYFSERTVVNIDGVVNPDAFHALREHRLLAYLRSADVEYIADRDGAWRYMPAFIRPDDWSDSLWGEDPNVGTVAIAAIDHNTVAQMRIWRLQ